jgi:membrane-associated protease RseP (regulator of RpoE activity)
MKRALGFGLILLAASAVGTQSACARGPAAEFGGHFLLGGVGVPAARSGQGYLGVDIRDVTVDQLAVLKLKEARGAEIVLVDHDAPAGKAGLREHDVLLRINGQILEGEEQTRRMLRESPPGTTIVLLVSRDGQLMTVTTQTANREEVEREAWERHMTVPEPVPDIAIGDYSTAPPTAAPSVRGNSFLGPTLMSSSYTGAMLETMSAQLAEFFGGAGLLVRSVEANSPAALAGLRAGDVVVRVNARVVANSSDWTRAIKDSHGRPLTVVVLREKKEQTLLLTPDAKKHSRVELPADTPECMVVALAGLFWSLRR